MMGRCTCQPPHPRILHRRGGGRCLVARCGCLFAPPPATHRAADPPARGRATVDDSGVVLAYEPPEAERAIRLSEREKLERLLWQAIDWARLPLPVLQYRWALSEGRQYRADGAYPDAHVLLEVQGGIWATNPGRHNRGSGYERDCERDNLAALMGWKLLRFTERMIKDGTAVKTIARALGRDEPAQPQLIGGQH